MYEPSALAQSFKPGKYRHFKGGIYDALFIARSSEAPDEEYVVYKSDDKDVIWTRPLKMFLEYIERDSYKGQRFEYIGER